MKTLFFIIYLFGFIVTYIAYRRNRLKEKDWTVQQLLIAIMFSLFNPIMIVVYFIYKIVTWNFWDRKLPKWF